MARGIAIRAITTLPDGQIEVAFSSGSPTAPPGQSGTYIFPSLTVVQDEIRSLENSLSDYQLLLLHLAITWLQPNGTFGNTNQVTNKELRLDTTAAQPLRIV